MKYNIGGLVILKPFGGNIFLRESVEHNENNNQLDGKSSDFYGDYLIKGTLNLESSVLEFDKIYEKGIKMKYSMRKKLFLPEGIFQGEVFTKGVEMPYGEAMCEIFQGENPRYNWEERAKTAEMSPEGMEKLTRITLENMAKKGYVEISKDRDGEKIVKLTQKGEDECLTEEEKEILKPRF